jgi:hypothetical protein
MIGGFFSDAWDVLTGKPQSWYTNVSNIQNQLAVVLAGVTGAGQELWDTVAGAAQGPTMDGSNASGIDWYTSVVGDIDSKMSSIIVTKSHVPEDSAIQAAAAAAKKYQAELDYVTSVAPEMAAQIKSDQQAVSQMLPGPMTSPAKVGQDEFYKALDERAKDFGSGVSDLLMYAGLGLLGAGILYASFVGSRR